MKQNGGEVLTRDEMALLHFFRGLSYEKQFEILEEAEGNFNAARRLEFLHGRETERPRSPGERH